MRGDLNLLAHVFAAETTSEPLLRRKVFRFAARHIPFASTLVEENIRWRNSDGPCVTHAQVKIDKKIVTARRLAETVSALSSGRTSCGTLCD
jgi:hypothetical protein